MLLMFLMFTVYVIMLYITHVPDKYFPAQLNNINIMVITSIRM
jgi:hypothetical protein